MIRKPKKEDLIRTAEIHIYGWRYAYKDLIPEQDLYNKRNVEKSLQKHKEILQNEKENFDIYDDGIIKGFALHGKCRDEDLKDYYELYAIYVEPNYIRQGVGQQLLKTVEKQSLLESKNKIVIWVMENNKKSVNFYKKHEFESDGKSKYIKQWNQKIIRMIKKL